MAQPSKAPSAILALFALPFLGGGLFFIYAQFASGGNVKPGNVLVGVMAASFFALFGGGLVFASFKGYGLLKKLAALQQANPLSPWLWREDWASRRAESQNKKSYIGAWIAAAFCNLITLPILFVTLPNLLRANDPRMFLVLGFNLVGVILLVNALRAAIRHERFGNTYFEFDSLPFSPGERLSGRIHLRFETQAAHGIDLRLSCLRKVISGSGKNSTTNQIVLWQADKNISSGAVSPGPLGRAIPVDFTLPPESLLTNHTDLRDQVLWMLHAQADVPGVDYSDDFELPVFRTSPSAQPANESPLAAVASALQFGFATERTADADEGAVPQPARIKVVVTMHDGGTEFYFPAFRTPGRALMLLAVSVAFTGAVYALIHAHVPLLFTALFAASDLFVIFGFFHVAFGSARIFVGNGEIQSRRGFLGFGALRRIPFSEIASIVPVASMQQGGGSVSSVYAIRMFTKSGRKVTLADEIGNRQEARWIVAQIEILAGLKLDTHVEVDLPLGVAALPTQTQSAQKTIRIQVRASSLASFVSFAIFAVMMLALFAWHGKGFLSSASRGVRANNSRTSAAPRPKPVAPRVFSGPLTDADVSRVLALPAQAQAEELLERAIGHDAKALELLNQQVENWPGRIHQSDRMAALIQRSQYSRDLRVRLANVDVSLAVEGLHKNEQAANSLMDRASTDPQHRAWAVYYLGMLAGRGVEYDRIHRVVLDYARNDKDPRVRQWAVEGLRFLAKDEVLDELFASFTEDTSMSVRDRAGCNIADCGIFTRKQRMRMVPKLIDQAAQQSTSAQMRTWCFLALSEITDQNLPADAAAWNQWYVHHGSEKMAEFERLEWWQVRGDE